MEKKRVYRLKERAKSREETRRRIVEAAMHLHEEVGPRATTISAIAERAGVQRLTVYRHFCDETAVFQACTSHWLSLNPPPDAEGWAATAEPREKLKQGLASFYAYYSRTRRMWTVSHRDVADVPALQGPMCEFEKLVAAVGADLAAAFATGAAPDRHAAVTIRHALAFSTWADLDGRGLDDDGKVELVVTWVEGTRRQRSGPGP